MGEYGAETYFSPQDEIVSVGMGHGCLWGGGMAASLPPISLLAEWDGTMHIPHAW